MALYWGRLLGFVLYLIVLVAFALYWAITTKRVCEYPSCDLKGVIIKDGMRQYKSACSDFKQFTCGKMHASKVSIFDEIVYHLFKFEEMILTTSIDYNYYHFLRPVQEFYNLCMTENADPDYKLYTLIEPIMRRTMDIRPIARSGVGAVKIEMLEYRLRTRGFKGQSLFSLYINQDQENKDEMALYIGLPITTIFYDQFELTKGMLYAYTLRVLEPFIKFYRYQIPPKPTADLVRYHIEFYRVVRSFKSKKVTYFKTKADKLMKMYPYYNWKLLISRLYPHLNLKKVTIYLKYKGFFDKLKTFVADKQGAAMFMAYNNVLEIFLHVEYARNIRLLPRYFLALTDRKQWCKNLVYSYFGPGINSYIIEKFQIKKVKQEVLAVIVDNIKKALENSVMKADWMPNEAKMESIDKIRTLRARLGFSEEHFDELASPFIRYNYYREVCVPDNIFNALTYLNRFLLGKNVELTHRNISIFDKSVYPEFHGVVYDDVENMLIIPTSILQFSAYDNDWPMSVNFAGIGTEISRTLISGLELKGSRCLKTATCKKWMNTTMERYIAKENSCLEFIRNNEFEDDVDDLSATSIKMMDDLSAVKIAFEAYELYFSTLWKDDVIIEDLEDYSSKELFFMSYASMYCSDKPDLNKPKHYVNITAMDLVHETKFFKDTFGCGRAEKKINNCLIV